MPDIFNQDYWNKKIVVYEAAEWSGRPSHFAQIAATYFPKHARILELGTGAGQDGLWFAEQGYEVVLTDASDEAFDRIRTRAGKHDVSLQKLDVTQPFDFVDASFDVVYAQLVLHYFTDNMTQAIIAEIERILKTGGILACMVNSTNDPEYDPALVDENQLIEVNGLIKRFFSQESFAPFVTAFEPILFDSNGRTPKDEAKGTSGMIQFIGKKRS